MRTDFKISAIENNFNHLFNLSEKELALKGIVKMTADEKPGFPCRISLEDAEIGEEVILLPFHHHKINTPYQGIGPIFIRKDVKKADLGVNEVPKMLLFRLLSLRIYDNKGMMIDAKTIEGNMLKKEIKNSFKNSEASYIHIHHSSYGCYKCQVNRIE